MQGPIPIFMCQQIRLRQPSIIILCPNCHAMYDFSAIELNKKDIRDTSKHSIGEEYIDYYNKLRFRRNK